MRRFIFDITRTSLIIVNLIIAALAFMLIFISLNAIKQDIEFNSLSKLYSVNNNNNDTNQQPRIIHTYVAIFFAIVAIIIALLALIGLIGSAKKSKTILATYSAIIFALILLLFILVILTYTINNHNNSPSNGGVVQYKEVDKSFVNSTVIVYNYIDSSDMKTKIIDSIQRSFSCCGVNSPNDWTEYSLHKIPKSCCSEPIESSLPVFKYCSESDYKIGCWKALTDHFNANLNSVRIVMYALISFGLICILAALFMIRTLRKGLEA